MDEKEQVKGDLNSEQIKSLVKKHDLIEALDLLEEWTIEKEDSKARDEVVLLKSKYYALSTEKRTGVINDTDFRVNEAKYTLAILELTRILEKDKYNIDEFKEFYTQDNSKEKTELKIVLSRTRFVQLIVFVFSLGLILELVINTFFIKADIECEKSYVQILVGTPIRDTNWEVLGLAKRNEKYIYTSNNHISPKGEKYYEVYLGKNSTNKTALVWSRETELVLCD